MVEFLQLFDGTLEQKLQAVPIRGSRWQQDALLPRRIAVGGTQIVKPLP
jgi:hypothetical protein